MKPEPDIVTIYGEIEFVFCGGKPRPEDIKHMASTVHCVNDEIIALLQQRERRQCRRSKAD
jgi:hypothetical protein